MRRIRTGTLDAGDELELSRDLEYGHWHEMRGVWQEGPNGIREGFQAFSNGSDQVVDGSGGVAPKSLWNRLTKMLAVANDKWSKRLEAKGTRVLGPVRIFVVDANPSSAFSNPNYSPGATWTLSLALKDAPLYKLGVKQDSALVSDSAEVSKLHDLRRLYEDGTWSTTPHIWFIPIADPDNPPPQGPLWRYQLLMYDVSPVDDDKGNVKLTW